MSQQDPAEIDFSLVLAAAMRDMKNSISMLLDTVDELRARDPDGSGYCNTLHYEAERLHNDLEQLLGIYRLRKNRLSAHLDEHHIPDFLQQQLARHTPLLDGLGLRYDVVADDITGFFDESLLGSVLGHAINNAIRYTRSQLRLGARKDRDHLVISVEDNGPGYPRHMQDTETTDFTHAATSLGLFFASSVARLHTDGNRTGCIRLRNGGELGGGIFEIWLP